MRTNDPAVRWGEDVNRTPKNRWKSSLNRLLMRQKVNNDDRKDSLIEGLCCQGPRLKISKNAGFSRQLRGQPFYFLEGGGGGDG